MAKYPDVTAGQTEACINRLGGWDNFIRFIGGQGKVVFDTILSIDRTYPFNPSKFMAGEWKITEEDEHSLALTEIDLSKVLLRTMLKEGETKGITGEEKLKRIKASTYIRFDAKVLQALWENQYFIPKSWKEKVNGNTRFIFFNGTVLQNPLGDRYVLGLYWNDGRWVWFYSWIGDGWGIYGLCAVLAV